MGHRKSDRYLKVVEWSEEDGCYVGTAPPPTADKKYSGKILLRIPPPLHKALAVKALREGESINKVIQHRLKAKVAA